MRGVNVHLHHHAGAQGVVRGLIDLDAHGHDTNLDDAGFAEAAALVQTRIVVLGGTESVSDAVPASLAKDGRAVDRVAGTDRYETAAAIARTSFPGKASTVFIASGENYADALAGAPAAGAQSAPILLVNVLTFVAPS